MTNPAASCIGVSINTSGLDEKARKEVLARAEKETGLPCVDPIATGVSPLIANLA